MYFFIFSNQIIFLSVTKLEESQVYWTDNTVRYRERWNKKYNAMKYISAQGMPQTLLQILWYFLSNRWKMSRKDIFTQKCPRIWLTSDSSGSFMIPLDVFSGSTRKIESTFNREKKS